jgi:hypothetical protein
MHSTVIKLRHKLPMGSFSSLYFLLRDTVGLHQWLFFNTTLENTFSRVNRPSTKTQ